MNINQYSASVFSILIFCNMIGPSDAQIVEIPDTAFLYALTGEGVDINGDSLISYSEAETVTSLDLSGVLECEDGWWAPCAITGNITNLEGIEAFPNLDTLG